MTHHLPPSSVADLLRQRIQTGLHLGVLRPGDRLASVRDVAAELHRRAAAVLDAYHQLADEGLVQLRTRSGVFVATPQESEDLPDVASWVLEVFLQGLARGIYPVEMERAARASLESASVRAVCVECNDDQLSALCSQLSGDFGFEARALDLGALGPRRAQSIGAAETDVIVTTRFHAVEAQRLGRRWRRPVIIATLDPAFVSEVRRMLSAGPVWWICTDARFTAKLSHMFPQARIHPMVLGRDPLEAVPARAMVYATRRAAERLPRGWRRGEVVTMTRAFSRETARELLTYRIRRSLLAAQARSARRA